METVLESLLDCGNPLSETQFEIKIREQFENRKKAFNGTQGDWLEVLGLPYIPECGLTGASKL
jgi:hypothetical protein